MRRLVAFLTGGGLTAALSVGFGGSSAYALAPTQQGWWTATNSGSVMGAPGAPPPPDVPAKGLLIEGGPSSAPGASDSGPTSFAALVYDFAPDSTVGRLTLSVAPGSGTTPLATIELCALTNPAIPTDQGGPMSAAPSFDCRTRVTADPSASGSSYQVNVSALVSPAGGLAVAILPTSPLDRVVFSQPGADSLPVQEGSGSSSGIAGAPGGTGGGPVGGGISTPAPTASTGSGAATPVADGAVAAPAAPVTGLQASNGAVAPPALATAEPSAAPVQPAPSVITPASSQTAGETQFTAAAGPSPKADPLVVGLLLAAVLGGGAVWLAVGRAAAGAVTDGGKV